MLFASAFCERTIHLPHQIVFQFGLSDAVMLSPPPTAIDSSFLNQSYATNKMEHIFKIYLLYSRATAKRILYEA